MRLFPMRCRNTGTRFRARTIWEAFSRFCHGQTGLEPETVLQACFPPALGLPNELEEVAGSAQVDSASLEDYEATPSAVQRRRSPKRPG